MLRYTLVLSVLIWAILLATPQVMTQGLVEGFRICPGDFALCAASICEPTGEMIAVNTATGTANFPEAQCTCPIFPGPSIADVNGGNMEGSCEPPDVVNGEPTNEGLWSLYAPMGNIPQEINNFNKSPKKSEAPGFDCPGDTTNTFANCFSFACVQERSKV